MNLVLDLGWIKRRIVQRWKSFVLSFFHLLLFAYDFYKRTFQQKLLKHSDSTSGASLGLLHLVQVLLQQRFTHKQSEECSQDLFRTLLSELGNYRQYYTNITWCSITLYTAPFFKMSHHTMHFSEFLKCHKPDFEGVFHLLMTSSVY